MKDYILTIGLEIHAELSTKTKMFCNSGNNTDESRPNTNVCPICLGYPGTLPVINKEAVRSVLRLGVAIGGEIADYTEFDRKNYFYPDIPKGYQISQYEHPLVRGGLLTGVAITRVHLEEDTAKSIHNDKGDSLLDFNRAGVPLMELVTEPVIKTAEAASNFARELQLLLKYLNISGANMEKGEMRVEANVSVSKDNKKGTKVEIKNLNSFKVVEKAIKFEMARQIEALERGEKVLQETRGWDENKEITFTQRLKESAHDYRYFPDPDLPKLFIKAISEYDEEVLRASLPELPWQKRERYKRDFGLKEGDIEIYVREPEWGRLFEEVAEILRESRFIELASNYITSDLKIPIPAKSLAEVIRMVVSGAISSRGAKDILKILQEKNGDPRTIAEENNLIQRSNKVELQVVVEKIISENETVVNEFKKGKAASLQFLIGQAMKEMKGSGNPVILKEIFQDLLTPRA
ncbi:MAG: Asp-tRNA(Asn)/Glu-tRNA(Gln) amidotransferase subunit GatB [bacterium]|nr:Asp-tRNA(Asn)/Glu-tRNA(Gln) amidotransferase subunit GatB [bacterium]